MADQDIDTQLMSIMSFKLMNDQKYVKYRYNNKEPSKVLKALTQDEKRELLKEAEESRKIINDDKASFSTMMKTSFSNIKGTVAASMANLGSAASGVQEKATERLTGLTSAFSNRFGSNKDDQNTRGGKRKSRKQKKSKKSKKNKSKKSKK